LTVKNILVALYSGSCTGLKILNFIHIVNVEVRIN
jgi:hypothetical protein